MGNTNMECWICGKTADSSEHKIKKAALIKVYGNNFKHSKMAHIKNGKLSHLQGPNSKKIKYESTLCKVCNGHGTQKYDRSYDTFFNFVQREPLKIAKRRMIDFYDVYGSDFLSGQLNLFKYFVKLLGCDLVATGFEVPPDLIDLLGKRQFRTKLVVTFAVNIDKLLLKNPNDAGMGIGSLVGWYPDKEHAHGTPEGYIWEIFFSFLHIYYWYNRPVDGPLGAPWIANNRYIYMGSFDSLSPEQRE